MTRPSLRESHVSVKVIVFLGIGLLLSLAATPVVASDRAIDLTLAATYQFGGGFELEDFEFGFIDIEIDDSDGAAMFLGIPVGRSLQIELIAVRQATSVSIDEGHFARDFTIGDLNLDYYHLGLLWQFPIGQIEPYIAFSAGITNFGFDIAGVSDDNFPSIGLGGGIKARFTPHVGLRVDGRIFVTSLDDSYYDDYDYCRGHCDQGDNMVQGFVAVGLLLTF